MSISINNHPVESIDSLSHTAQLVIQLLDRGQALFSRVIASDKVKLYFDSELDFLKVYWHGVNGIEVGYLPSVKSWATPQTLYALEPQQLQQLAAEQTSTNEAKLNQLYQSMNWYSVAIDQAFSEFEQSYFSDQGYRLAQLSCSDKAEFYYRVLQPLSNSDVLQTAVESSLAGTFMNKALLDAIEFAISLARLNLSSDTSNRPLMQSLEVQLEPYFTAPSLPTPPDESALAAVQSSWFESHDAIGFSSLSNACRLLAQLFTEQDDITTDLAAVVSKKVALIKQFFTTIKANNAYLSQCGKYWYYQYANEEYRAQLRWQPEQILTLVNFEPVAPATKAPTKAKTGSNNRNKTTGKGKSGGKTNKEAS